MYAMLVLRGPQGRLVIPTESPSLNKVFTYFFTYLLKNKTPLRGNESFSNSTFYGAIVSNTQYLTSGGLIYSDNTNFYCIP